MTVDRVLGLDGRQLDAEPRRRPSERSAREIIAKVKDGARSLAVGCVWLAEFFDGGAHERMKYANVHRPENVGRKRKKRRVAA